MRALGAIPGCLVIVMFLGLRPGILVPAQTRPDTDTLNTGSGYSISEADSLKIARLLRLAFIHFDQLDDTAGADRLSEMAVRIAEQSKNPRLLMLAYNGYLESNDVDAYYHKALTYARKAIQISREEKDPGMEARAWHNLAYIYELSYDCSQVFVCGKNIFFLTSRLNNTDWMAQAYLHWGNSLACENKVLDAFEKFLKATEIAETAKDTTLLVTCYAKLSEFFNNAKLFDKAREYKAKQSNLISARHPVDSVALMWTLFDLGRIDSRERLKPGNSTTMMKVIDFAIRHRNVRMKNYELALYRQYLLDTEQKDSLYILYNVKYPAELAKLKTLNLPMFYRLHAFFAEVEKKYDSAIYFFNKAAALVEHDQNLFMQSNFHRRYGQFLERHGWTDQAIREYLLAYSIADRNTSSIKFEYMLNASRALKNLYSQKKDYYNAFLYSDRTNQVNDSISNMITSMTRKEEFLMLDINRVIQRREKANELEKQRAERTIRQQKAQRNMMAAGVIFLVVLSYLIYRNYRNQKRSNKLLDAAKKKSDHLLLNILPYETAEELKLTGSAKAKRYDEVTVMFTDFKDFTQASERMSPEELVGIINSYFSEFDKIVSRLGIEKIKIIGDSYMCAGGLPVANSTHAVDVVNAALELQAFMESERRDRTCRGEFFFELRIGIHTGPVIAGIVGLRKFAYDIWGDTVNTASRMENAGEVNKVNISGSTYERVKNQFKCIYRGKVSAKHKGEVDMYFVESYSAGEE